MEHLEWEERNRVRAALAALLAGVLMIGGLFYGSSVGRDQPQALLLDSLRNVEKDGPIGGLPSVRTAEIRYLDDHSGGLIATALITLGVIGVMYALYFLSRAVAARRDFPRLALPAILGGGSLMAASLLIGSILQQGYYGDKVAGPLTVDSIGDGPASGAIIGLVAFVGLIGFSLGVVLTALNAMRAGLLTRTMGILGMFAGGGTVVFVNPSQPLLPLWTAFLGPLFLGRWMGGQPRAWTSGKAEPWPSAAEMREQRTRGGGQLAEPDPEPVEAAAPRVHPSSKKRKRKRRT